MHRRRRRQTTQPQTTVDGTAAATPSRWPRARATAALRAWAERVMQVPPLLPHACRGALALRVQGRAAADHALEGGEAWAWAAPATRAAAPERPLPLRRPARDPLRAEPQVRRSVRAGKLRVGQGLRATSQQPSPQAAASRDCAGARRQQLEDAARRRPRADRRQYEGAAATGCEPACHACAKPAGAHGACHASDVVRARGACTRERIETLSSEANACAEP